MEITGTLIKNYLHCKRQAWLYSKGLNFSSELTKIGNVRHNEAGSSELVFDQIKIDKIKKDEVLEFKKSSSNLEGVKFQLLYYLYILRNKGIEKKGRLKDLTYGDEYVLELNEENLNKIEDLLNEIRNFLKETKQAPERKPRKKDCKGCSFFDYCWSV